MRYIPLFFIFFLFISTVLSYAQQGTYTIDGTVNQPAITVLYFTKTTFYDGNAKEKAQKIALVNGKFTIKGLIDEPVPAFFSLSEDYKKDVVKPKQFILDKGNISVEIKSELTDALVKGSKANDDLTRYN